VIRSENIDPWIDKALGLDSRPKFSFLTQIKFIRELKNPFPFDILLARAWVILVGPLPSFSPWKYKIS
jgi:hypothetical protein